MNTQKFKDEVFRFAKNIKPFGNRKSAGLQAGFRHMSKFKYLNRYVLIFKTQEDLYMDLGAYFQILIGIMMTATFITLALILLNVYYGKDEEENSEED
jgi:hypothetical protein